MSQKYKYKGVVLTDIFDSQAGTISSGYGYTDFPNFNKSGDSHKIYTDTTTNKLFKSFTSITPGYTSSPLIATIAKEVILNSSTTTTVPTWTKAVKFDIQNTNGSTGGSGGYGAKGSTGSAGPKGYNGYGGSANGSPCFYSGCWTNYQFHGGPGGYGGPGGPGGSGGSGGSGGAGGSGGQGGDGGTSRISTIIELSETNRDITFVPNISGQTNGNKVTVYDKNDSKIEIVTYKGGTGGTGGTGGRGATGGTGGRGARGGQGGYGGACTFEQGHRGGSHGGRGGTGATGASGSKGATGASGSTGSKGVKGAVGSISSSMLTAQGSVMSVPNTIYRATTSDNINQAKLYYFID